MIKYFNLGYLIEMLMPVIGLCALLEKRKFGVIKGAISVFIGANIDIIIIYIMSLTIPFENVSNSVNDMNGNYLFLVCWFLITWLSVITGIYLSSKVKYKEAIYLFAISYTIEHIFYCVRKLVNYHFSISEYNPVLYTFCIIGSFLTAYFWFSKATVKNGKYKIETMSATWATVMIMVLVWGLSIWADYFEYTHIHALYAILACLFLLISQRAQLIRENERSDFQKKEQLWNETKMRYQMSRDAMAVVNQHYHDMKHQINVLSNMENDEKRRGILSEMENDIAIYDAVVRTGNEYLDTVLTEKKLICHSKNIQMSCIVDGKQLEFIDELDLYTLLGNALDNAIEANEKIIDNTKRWISVQIQNKKGIVLVEIVNPYQNSLKYKGDAFETSKEDKLSHGYGISSIKNIVEKYSGQLIIKTENSKFLLRIIFNN
ncbi:MAG: GHKL domain-containing protein [Pseudobutyrivibrio sp.]|nr:GHKL domain-containing protein [Pseudobutyrivibrio sp.]